MRLDPHTTVARLLIAIPSSALAFTRLGIPTGGNESKSLQQVCKDSNIGMERFLATLDDIDWNLESPDLADRDRS